MTNSEVLDLTSRIITRAAAIEPGTDEHAAIAVRTYIPALALAQAANDIQRARAHSRSSSEMDTALWALDHLLASFVLGLSLTDVQRDRIADFKRQRR